MENGMTRNYSNGIVCECECVCVLENGTLSLRNEKINWMRNVQLEYTDNICSANANAKPNRFHRWQWLWINYNKEII